MVLNTCFLWRVQAFFIVHFEVQFFLPYLLRWCYVTLDNFLLVSSKWWILIPEALQTLGFICFIFSFCPEFQPLSIILSRSSLSKSLRGLNLILYIIQLFWIFLLFTGVSSWRLYMVVHQRFYPFSKSSRRFFSKELKYSSSCNPECKFFLPYYRRWYCVILDNLSSCFHDSHVVKNEIF